jgi:hypothetical protein
VRRRPDPRRRVLILRDEEELPAPLKLPNHLPWNIRGRRGQHVLELVAGNRHNVTCGNSFSFRIDVNNSENHEVAISCHADMQDTGYTSHNWIS